MDDDYIFVIVVVFVIQFKSFEAMHLRFVHRIIYFVFIYDIAYNNTVGTYFGKGSNTSDDADIVRYNYKNNGSKVISIIIDILLSLIRY